MERRDAPGVQLLIREAGAIERLRRIAPQLMASGNRRRWLMPLLAVAVLIVAGIALLWHLDVKPARAIAGLLPDGVRQSIGRSVVEQFKAKGAVCNAPAGRQALNGLMARLLGREPSAALFTVTVVNLPFSNAFATAGGQIVITGRMIATAQSPDEVAGVLAHEIGHGIERHPDAGLVRALGLSFLLELFSGDSGMLGGITLHVLQTGYIRQDELAADQQALRLLKQAAISQNGLENFFARNATKNKAKILQAFDFLRTHPYPRQRLAVVRRSQPYPATASLDDKEWQALRKICSTK